MRNKRIPKIVVVVVILEVKNISSILDLSSARSGPHNIRTFRVQRSGIREFHCHKKRQSKQRIISTSTMIQIKIVNLKNRQCLLHASSLQLRRNEWFGNRMNLNGVPVCRCTLETIHISILVLAFTAEQTNLKNKTKFAIHRSFNVSMALVSFLTRFTFCRIGLNWFCRLKLKRKCPSTSEHKRHSSRRPGWNTRLLLLLDRVRCRRVPRIVCACNCYTVSIWSGHRN